MREAAVAIEKNAVERAIRPACGLAAGSRVNSSPGSNASASQTATSALIARSSGSGFCGAVGVSKLGVDSGSGATESGSSRYSRRPPGAGKAPARVLDMANIASQKKRILRSERERTENRLLTSTVKTHFRRLEAAVEGGDAEAIATEQRELVSKVDKAVQKGALHRNTGARKKAKAARIAAGAKAA